MIHTLLYKETFYKENLHNAYHFGVSLDKDNMDEKGQCAFFLKFKGEDHKTNSSYFSGIKTLVFRLSIYNTPVFIII